MKWWRQSLTESEKKNPWTNVPNSVNVEMTSYSLLTYLKKGLVEDAFPIVRWLISQQNDQGGFASTQVNRNKLYFINATVINFLF